MSWSCWLTPSKSMRPCSHWFGAKGIRPAMVQNHGSGSLGGRPAREVSVQTMPISVHAVAMSATQGITDEVTVVYTDGACRGNPGPGGWGWGGGGGGRGTSQ